MSTAHVVPVNDLREHVENGADCWCARIADERARMWDAGVSPTAGHYATEARAIAAALRAQSPEYVPTEPMRGGVHVRSRTEELAVCLGEAHALITKLINPGANIDWNDGARLDQWKRHYAALALRTPRQETP